MVSIGSAARIGGPEHKSKADAPVVRLAVYAVAEQHRTVDVPVVMTAAAEAPVGTRTGPRRAVERDRVDVVGAGVLAPFPDVAAHVEDPELVRCLGRDVVG